MLPALFLLIITLPAMAALELQPDTFVILLLLACVVAGLTAPAGGRQVIVHRRRPTDEPHQHDCEIDDKPQTKSAAHVRSPALVD